MPTPSSAPSSSPFQSLIHFAHHGALQSPVPPGIGIAGILESSNVPRFTQMVGSKTINGGAWVGPGHNIAIFPHAVRITMNCTYDFRALTFYHSCQSLNSMMRISHETFLRSSH